jgi:hypothetical protein
MAKFEDVDIGTKVVIKDDASIYEVAAWNQNHTKVWLGIRITGCSELRWLRIEPLENIERWVE